MEPGDFIEADGFKGIFISNYDKGIILKLDDGYNIYLEPKKIKLIKKHKKVKQRTLKIKKDPKKKKIVILGAGGTIASKVDYSTGAVKPAMTPEEIISFTPRIHDLANIEVKMLFQLLSENMTPKHWSIIAKAVAEEINKGAYGIVIMHGTDTMSYTAAYLSYALQDLPVPVILVGAQRSTDRASCDTHINLLCAIKAALSDIAEVCVCMHEGIDDNSCVIHQGNKVRKMHTSRRDAFKSINVLPFARINYPSLEISYLRNDFRKRSNSKLKLYAGYDDKVALIKCYPGMSNIYDLSKMHGLVIEGTGLGHMPEYVFNIIKSFKGPIIMTSQTISGRINMNVYETGRKLLDLGVKGNLWDMTPEAAYAKLVWALGNKKNIEEIYSKEVLNRSEVL